MAFPIHHALRDELSWTHYRRLLQVQDEQHRLWYMNECAEAGWSTRQLARQIDSMFCERLLASQVKAAVKSFWRLFCKSCIFGLIKLLSGHFRIVQQGHSFYGCLFYGKYFECEYERWLQI